jgi:hypothetical protein
MNSFFCLVDWEKLVQVLSALLTPAIAIVAAYIAYQQYVTKRLQHRLAMLEKRMRVFDSTMDLIAAIVGTSKVNWTNCLRFYKKRGSMNSYSDLKSAITSTKFTSKACN